MTKYEAMIMRMKTGIARFRFMDYPRSEVEKFYAQDTAIIPDKRLTISAGIAAYPEDAVTKNELISTADAALYQAKHSGKNRVYLATKAMD